MAYTPFNTGNPIGTWGSVDPRDLVDNAAIIDRWVNDRTITQWRDRFGVQRLTWNGMEVSFQQAQDDRQDAFDAEQAEHQADFDAAQAQRESDFNAFLLSSGYQFIGDYDTDGPLTITQVNQIFSKDGEFWRAGAALMLPYTTVNDWATDEANFVSVGDAALRQELAEDDGANKVGWSRQALSSAVVNVHQALDAQAVSVWEFAGLIADKPTADPATWDWAPAIIAADAHAASIGYQLVFPAGVFSIGQTLTISNKSSWVGMGRFATTIKLLNGINATMLKTSGYDAAAGSNANLDMTFSLRGIRFDGNRANNTDGDGLNIYAHSFRIEDVAVINVAMHGIQSEWGAAGEPVAGLEAFISDIVVDTVGGHGWWWRGPHDAQVSKVVLIDCGQLTDNTYCGWYMSGANNGGLRAYNIHPWKRDETANICKAAAYINSGRFSMCFFEGAYISAWLSGGASIDLSTFASGRADATVVVEANDCSILQSRIANTRSAAINAIRMGASAGTSSRKLVVDSTSFEGYAQPILNCQNTGGFTRVHGKTFNCSTPLWTGTRTNTDRVNFVGDGSTSQNYSSEPDPFNSYSAGGSGSGDAVIVRGTSIRLTGLGNYRLEEFIAGIEYEIFSRASGNVYLYPPSGAQFIFDTGASGTTDAPLTIVPQCLYRVRVTSVTQGVVHRINTTYLTSISAAPLFIGQESLSGGQWYKATGVSSPSDWKQIT
ncbi:hypothetical protein [Pseudomonas citronellolis]|uniref:hypothetical protein n=1 Tax=Pseudomonas citronellolis TaxID=53408 RepID=UPI002D7862B0|nr:hypothetical protein [Pseudomonas citronellolis]WRT83456.1 hypothetical protein VK748_03250 [Pseudomonas citronellolis]